MYGFSWRGINQSKLGDVMQEEILNAIKKTLLKNDLLRASWREGDKPFVYNHAVTVWQIAREAGKSETTVRKHTKLMVMNGSLMERKSSYGLVYFPIGWDFK